MNLVVRVSLEYYPAAILTVVEFLTSEFPSSVQSQFVQATNPRLRAVFLGDEREEVNAAALVAVYVVFNAGDVHFFFVRGWPLPHYRGGAKVSYM